LPLRCVFQNLTKNLAKIFSPVALVDRKVSVRQNRIDSYRLLDKKNQYLDSTIVRAHQQVATGRKKGARTRLWGVAEEV
jgi:hypothetical protein